jgi:hypothetical protein
MNAQEMLDKLNKKLASIRSLRNRLEAIDQELLMVETDLDYITSELQNEYDEASEKDPF